MTKSLVLIDLFVIFIDMIQNKLYNEHVKFVKLFTIKTMKIIVI